MPSSEGYEGPLLITAWLSSPLAGDPPQLDALLEWCLAPFEPEFRGKMDRGEPHGRVDRALPAPEQGKIRIPILRTMVCGFLVGRCSNPIMPTPKTETVEYVAKRLSVENAELLSASERKVVTTTNAWTKSYRLPLRIRLVDRVCWFAVGCKKSVRKALRDVHAIGKKVADGYGRVQRIDVEKADEDYSWFAPCDGGRVLMRTMPLESVDPSNLFGWRRHFGACCPPYWHSSRFCETVTPC